MATLRSSVRSVARRLRAAAPDGGGVAGSVTSAALVATDRPDRYAKQLASHMAKRITTSWDDQARVGSLDFGRGRAELRSVADGLQLTLVAAAAELDGLEDAVGRHLVRFGARDELVVTWVRDDGSAGTVQRKLED